MPKTEITVKVYAHDHIYPELPRQRAHIQVVISEIVAEAMSYKTVSNRYVVMSAESDINYLLTFLGEDDRITTDMLIEISAVDYAERTKDIKDHLVKIGENIKKQFGGRVTISLAFFPISQDCLVKV